MNEIIYLIFWQISLIGNLLIVTLRHISFRNVSFFFCMITYTFLTKKKQCRPELPLFGISLKTLLVILANMATIRRLVKILVRLFTNRDSQKLISFSFIVQRPMVLMKYSTYPKSFSTFKFAEPQIFCWVW